MWSLTFMVDRQRRVERIPDDWADEIRPLVQQGREHKDAVAEVFAINAQLLALWRKQQTKKRKKKEEEVTRRRTDRHLPAR